jgi:hypothetical protein
MHPRLQSGVSGRPLNFTVRQPMKRPLFVLLSICFAAAFAIERGEWIQVKGGSWEPAAATLFVAGTKLRSALESRIGHKVSATQWRNYAFQYQGTLTSQGQRTIHLTAFCADLVSQATKEFGSNVDLAAKWLPTNMGGGSCFFSANYDVAHGSITDLEVAAPK